jgi:hypothetical protein
MSHTDLVIVSLADENAALRERVQLTDAYREALQLAIAQLAERNAELERSRRRVASLVAEVQALRGSVAA